MLWSPRAEPLVPAATRAREAVRQAGRSELQRLLYVALTRAQDRLLIAGWQGRKGLPQGCWYEALAAAMQRLGRSTVAFDDGPAWRLGEEPGGGTASPGRRVAPTAALPGFLSRPAPAEPKPERPLTPSRPETEAPAVLRPLDAAGGDRFRRGRVLHRLLQVLPELPAASRPDAALRLLTAELALSPPERARLADEAIAVLADARFAALFGPGSLAEVPLAGVVNGQTILGQVDRLCVLREQVQVVDFKSDRAAPKDAAGVPLAYLRQMAAYVSLIARIYPGRQVVAALLYTEAPRLIALPPSLLANHLP